jgi:hypothetical protein
MSTNEKYVQNEGEEFLDFLTPFDGTQAEIDSRERNQVADRFKSLVADTLLNNAADVLHDDHCPGFENDYIGLIKEDADEVRWSLSAKSLTNEQPPDDELESAEEIRKQITIQKIVKDYGRERVIYRLGSDGVVRRNDFGDIWAKTKQERQAELSHFIIKRSSTSHEELEQIQQAIEEMNESIQNSRLERKLGLNNQPISLQEMEGLEMFVRQPGFVALS